MPTAIREVPPGEAVFNLDKFGCVFDRNTLQLKKCVNVSQCAVQKILLTWVLSVQPWCDCKVSHISLCHNHQAAGFVWSNCVQGVNCYSCVGPVIRSSTLVNSLVYTEFKKKLFVTFQRRLWTDSITMFVAEQYILNLINDSDRFKTKYWENILLPMITSFLFIYFFKHLLVKRHSCTFRLATVFICNHQGAVKLFSNCPHSSAVDGTVNS